MTSIAPPETEVEFTAAFFVIDDNGADLVLRPRGSSGYSEVRVSYRQRHASMDLSPADMRLFAFALLAEADRVEAA
jgi:hypothetical protein